nr:reverse transcriptase domain-containing protein [Tanacetum cinerariifolium]
MAKNYYIPYFHQNRSQITKVDPLVGLFVCHIRSWFESDFVSLDPRLQLKKSAMDRSFTLGSTVEADNVKILQSCNGLLLCGDGFGSREFTIYEMTIGCSVWMVRYRVHTDDFITPLLEVDENHVDNDDDDDAADDDDDDDDELLQQFQAEHTVDEFIPSFANLDPGLPLEAFFVPKYNQSYFIKDAIAESLAGIHEKTSDQVEVSNRGLKHILERTVEENRASWSDKLDDALWAFHTTFRTPIGCTPYKLVYGKSCHLPIKLEHRAYWALKHVNFDLKTAGDHRKLQLNELNELHDQAYENFVIYKEMTKKLHESKIKNHIFNVGD